MLPPTRWLFLGVSFFGPCAYQPPPPTDIDPRAESAVAMNAYTTLLRARDGVVAGDIEGVREATGWLAYHGQTDPHLYPNPWNAQIASLQLATDQAGSAATVHDAAAAVAGIARACGDCHAAVGHAPSFPSVPIPAEQHHWAADRIWESLVAPSDDLWRAGVQALADPTIDPASAPDRRETVTGTLLAACSTCHAAIRTTSPP